MTSIEAFADKYRARIQDFNANLAEEIAKAVVAESPEISGKLKGAWHASLSEQGDGSTRQPERGNAPVTVSLIRHTVSRMPLGSTYFIVNNVVSEPTDDGGGGIHYAGIVNGTPDIRYNMDFAPLSFPSFMFFDRAVGNGMLVDYAETALSRALARNP